MHDHYYSRDPESERDLREFDTDIRGRTFTFMTDASVFSRRGIDYGTYALIERLPLPLQGDVLDLGCGYGPIGLSVAVFSPEASVTLVDINRRALELCRINAEKNGLDPMEVVLSDGVSALPGRYFHWIITNPPIRAGKRIVYRLFEQAYERLQESGEFWLVIHKKQGAPSALKKLQTLFPEVMVVARDKGYRIIRCKKTFDFIR